MKICGLTASSCLCHALYDAEVRLFESEMPVFSSPQILVFFQGAARFPLRSHINSGQTRLNRGSVEDSSPCVDGIQLDRSSSLTGLDRGVLPGLQ